MTRLSPILLLLLAALCALLCASDASAKGTAPVACSKAAPGVRCVPAACPPKSNGRPCRDPFAVCRRKGKKNRRCVAVKPRVVCGYSEAEPLLNERSVAYSYIWSLPKLREQSQSATWDGEKVAPDAAVPLIARLAAQGWDQERDVIDPIQRRLCAVDDRRLRALGTEIPTKLPPWLVILNWNHRPTTFRGVARYGIEQHERSLEAVNLHADRLGIGEEAPEREPVDDGQDERDEAACPPGTLINGVPC
jgi:hypothetical protein